jgi:predicted metalloprotease with PDZ domain
VVKRSALLLVVALALGGPIAAVHGASPISYRLSFPEPQHRWMQVDATFPDVTQTTLELRMSRSSPGRYSLHDFAKNVYDVHAYDKSGREVETTRPDPYGWNVSGHGGSVTVKYKVYGDRVDGTYLAVDTTHAHINMPAALMWARGLDDRPATVALEPPAGTNWQAATQLHRGATPLAFTAPNLQYLMDSPVELGPLTLRQFTVGSRTFRIALHHAGSEFDADALARDAEKIVRQEGAIYGEYPEYEPGYYTFIIDHLPYADGDGMEHRNSTVITSPAVGRGRLDDTVAHEFFHAWNVERIRPKGLEPFDFDRANLTDSLWLAEGFTQYYGPLTLQRAGLEDLGSTARALTNIVDAVVNDPGRTVRSAADMSLMAPFIDQGRTVDRTNWSNTVISYYTYGGAIAVALDLALRDRTDSRVSLDDYMRAMWQTYGKPGGSREGYVDRPYSLADAEETLAKVSGDRAFAHDFFAKYIEGREAADYGRLLARAGFALRKRQPGRAWLGELRVQPRDGARVSTLVAPTWPVYAAGLDQDDELRELDGQRIGNDNDIAALVSRHKPGDRIAIAFTDRTGRTKTATVTLGENPGLEVVPVDSPSDAQKKFRDAWLGPK